MFVELVQGRAIHPAGLHETWGQALASIAQDAVGWLGTTSGVTADGGFVAMLGFESEETARITMDRLDRRAAWDRIAPHVANQTFRECPHVRAFSLRDLRYADLVEVTQGPVNDIGRVISGFERSSRRTADETVIGGLLCWDDTGFASSALYRRSPEAGAASAPSVLAQDAPTLFNQPVRFDLADPWSILIVAETPPRDERQRHGEANDDRPMLA